MEDHIRGWTDHYFLKTKKTVERFGDKQVTYAVFMRRPVIFTPKLMVAWLDQRQREAVKGDGVDQHGRRSYPRATVGNTA